MSAERETIIQVEDFTAAYDGQVVLERLNFEVYAGEVFAILGALAALGVFGGAIWRFIWLLNHK
jgi:ABC-type transporter Mla maintaining outer membrane lipid asymmetry ATPase subunit MlaF